MRYAALTDVGRRRSSNEDSHLADGRVFAVADGMGGHLAGEVASGIAIDALRDITGARDLERLVIERVQRANSLVFERAQADSDRHGMGTTLTACVVEDNHLIIAHVGDSRLYRLRDGRLKQLTKDHSLVAQMIERGHIKPEEAAEHPQRNVITRALGIEENLKIDIKSKEMAPGDRYLLATDGLTSVVSDDEIASVMASEDALEGASEKLISLANARGGPDNITVVVFEPEGWGRTRPKKRWVMKTITGLLAVAWLAYGGWIAWQYVTSGFYLGERNGRVAIFRGVPGDFAGFTLHTLVKETDIETGKLPAPYQRRLNDGLPVGDLNSAERTIVDYRSLIKETR